MHAEKSPGSGPARRVLASGSPRRRAILARLGVPFEVIEPRDIEESAARGAPESIVRSLALAKAVEVLERLTVTSGGSDPWVLAADTLVSLEKSGGPVLGKPADQDEARRMLRLLSDRTHSVWTGVAVARRDRPPAIEVERSEVTFRRLGHDDVEAYVSSGEPFGKAGAYGIQGLGGRYVAAFRGCYYNIVGLPLVRAARLLGLAEAAVCDCGTHPLQGGAPGCRIAR